ncbi:MAG: NUDIX domain-containing protein [Gemmatimonadota bacterium]
MAGGGRAGEPVEPPGISFDLDRLEREEFMRGQVPPGEVPVRPRPAATVVVARPTVATSPTQGKNGERGTERAGSGFEVLLLRRPSGARFAAGAYVFPGGTIDPGDGAPELVRRVPAGLRREAPALIAGLRELFEETGFLLADDALPPAQLREARRDLLEGRRGFLDVVRHAEVSFGRLRAVYLSRWITPKRLSRRYDTRFFLAEWPGGGEPELTDELESHVWLAPADAVARSRDGRLPMLIPTRYTLEMLSRHSSVASIQDGWRDRVVEPILPRLLVVGSSVRPVLPGDPAYEEAE